MMWVVIWCVSLYAIVEAQLCFASMVRFRARQRGSTILFLCDKWILAHLLLAGILGMEMRDVWSVSQELGNVRRMAQFGHVCCQSCVPDCGCVACVNYELELRFCR